MDLSQLQLKLRPRSGWAACDTGQLLARQHYGTLLLIWFASTAFPLLALNVAFYWEPLWAALLFWWLKPLWERPILYYLSKAVFNAPPSIKECIKVAPKLWLKQWFLSLTWRRFSPSRSFDLPVILLENQRGKARSKRLGILHRRNTGSAFWLLIILFHIEALIPYALIGFGLYLYPHPIDFNPTTFQGWLAFSENYWVFVASALVAWLSAGLIVPFYVASGFVLYLNRRTQLEGWDIEIAFRRMVEKRSHDTKPITQAITGILFAILAIGFTNIIAEPAHASEQQAQISEQKDIDHGTYDSQGACQISRLDPEGESKIFSEEIAAVLATDEFHQKGTERRWNQNVKDWFKREKKKKDTSSDFDWSGWGGFAEGLVFFIKYLAYAIPIAIAGYLIYRYRNELKTMIADARNQMSQHEKPLALFGLDVSKESLPDDIPKALKNLLQQQQYRDVLALMYRASLATFLHDHHVKFRPGDTEGDCLRKVKKVIKGNRVSVFKTLTITWQQVAYGHKEISNDKLTTLVDSWVTVFGSDLEAASNEPN